MIHAIKGRKLGRNSAHRKALLRNLSLAILTHESIRTTLPKAKEIRPYIEKILTLAKNDNLANRRLAISILGNQEIINKLFKDIGPRIANRNGGYLRIMKFGFRTGDKAPMAIVELVDKKEKIPTVNVDEAEENKA
jgi:large subunit ribosomal protein L17